MGAYDAGCISDTSPSTRADDPRWEWFEVTVIGDRERKYIRGRCNHLETVPVESVTGEIVASLCLTCDSQLETDR